MQVELLQTVISGLAQQADQAFALRLPGGELRRAGAGEPRFTLAFRTQAPAGAACGVWSL